MKTDYLLVNSTNEFLIEYTPLEENSCYKLTNFSGGVGDALISTFDKKIKLFVDGRFHTQAPLEVDEKKVEVIKLEVGQCQDETICSVVKPNSTFGINTKKVSQKRYEFFETLLKELEVKVVPVISEENTKRKTFDAVCIDKYLTGLSFKDKCDKLEKPTLITNSEEISYLCNLRNFQQDYAVKIDGKLLLLKDRSILFTDYKIIDEVEFEIKNLNEFDEYIKTVKETLIVDKTTISAYDYALIQEKIYKPSCISQLKALKTKEELEHLKYCFEMTDKALMATREYIEKTDNISEYDIEKNLEKNFKNFGAKSLSFHSIIARNQNSALPHYSNNSKEEVVKSGDLVLIDCGAYYDGGLATDITRVFVKGEPTKLHKKVYTIVLKMFLNAFNHKVIEGKTEGFEIDSATREYLSKNEIEGFIFNHGLGHGIGVCVHEAPPNLSKNSIAKTPLKNNMCFTIEPGLYNEKEFGVRLENSCYLEDGIIKSFTNMCYESKLIDYTLLTEQENEWLSEFEVM